MTPYSNWLTLFGLVPILHYCLPTELNVGFRTFVMNARRIIIKAPMQNVWFCSFCCWIGNSIRQHVCLDNLKHQCAFSIVAFHSHTYTIHQNQLLIGSGAQYNYHDEHHLFHWHLVQRFNTECWMWYALHSAFSVNWQVSVKQMKNEMSMPVCFLYY